LGLSRIHNCGFDYLADRVLEPTVFYNILASLGLEVIYREICILITCLPPIPMLSMTARRLRQSGSGMGAFYLLMVGTGCMYVWVLAFLLAPVMSAEVSNFLTGLIYILSILGFFVFSFSALACLVKASRPDKAPQPAI